MLEKVKVGVWILGRVAPSPSQSTAGVLTWTSDHQLPSSLGLGPTKGGRLLGRIPSEVPDYKYYPGSRKDQRVRPGVRGGW